MEHEMASATLPQAPASDLESRIAARPYWYHRIELPGGVVTPGWAPISKVSYCIPDDLTGKRVLDIGAWDGFWTFEALQRGAREVVAIDDFSDFLGSLRTSDRTGWENFDLCRSAFGYSSEVCDRREMSVYDISEEKLGRFDVVFFFGTLYHLRHPLLALDKIASVCDSELYVESAILDDYSPYRGGLGQGYPNGQMVMEFYPEAQYGNNTSNWWVPTLHCLVYMIKAAGFAQANGWKLTLQAPTLLAHCRGFAKGIKNL
jgi:tRNA (mo5U34)-methyltransferase